jgi:hypothetical protein
VLKTDKQVVGMSSVRNFCGSSPKRVEVASVSVLKIVKKSESCKISILISVDFVAENKHRCKSR